MKKKVLSLVMCGIMIVQLFAGLELKTSASGTFDPWYEYTAISTKSDLDAVRNNLNGKYLLTNDIIFLESDFMPGGDFYNDGNGWLAIGSENQPFNGVFDGCNYTITGIKFTPSDTQNIKGLFGVNNGTIERVILNAEIEANITLTTSNAQKPCALLTGVNNYTGIIRNCSASGNLNYSITKEAGLASINSGTSIGSLSAINYGKISQCSNTANINLDVFPAYDTESGSSFLASFSVGGICGDNFGTVINGYNTGSIYKNYVAYVSSHNDTGNLDYATVYDHIGGICGSNSGNIQYCYNTGNIQNSGYSSAIVDYYNGPSDPKILGDCYFLDNMTIGSRYANAETNAELMKTTCLQMKQKATYAGWDFYGIWDIVEGEGYPFLRKDLTNIDNEHMAFSAGNGSESDPFVIDDARQFMNISQYLDRHFLIGKDIALAEDFVFPKDGLGLQFKGTLDGGNKTISGFTVWPKIFGLNLGIIRNLTLAVNDAEISLKSSFNSASIGGFVISNWGSIQNCTILGEATLADTGAFTDCYYIGGITSNNTGEISDCHSYLNITAPFTNTGTVIIGGISGKNSGIIYNSSNHGNILVTGCNKINLGGIAGNNTDSVESKAGTLINLVGRIKQCFNAGDLCAIVDGGINCHEWVRVGGIAGVNDAYNFKEQSRDVENCFNIGNITAINYNDEINSPIKVAAGGVIGYNGLCGRENYCYNSGAVETYADGLMKPENVCGALVGENEGTINGSISLDLGVPCIGKGSSSGVMLKTMEQMRDQRVFSEFDFTDVWEFQENSDFYFPVLKNTAFSFNKKSVGIQMIAPPEKTTFREDEIFDFTGLKVNVLYNNGFVELTNNIEVVCDEINYGVNQMQILYSDADYYYVLPLEITVNPKPVDFISMETPPVYTMYFVNGYLDLEGATVKIHYTDGTFKIIDITYDMVAEELLSSAGIIPVTVEFYGKKTSFNVSVFNKYLTSTKYFINNSSKIVSGISENTNVSILLNGIDPKELSFVTKNSKLLVDSDIVGTGCILAMTDGNAVLDWAYAVVTGDVNGDGKITLTDYAKLKAHLLNREKLTDAYLLAADINGDGNTTLTDYAKMKSHLLGRDTIIPKKY